MIRTEKSPNSSPPITLDRIYHDHYDQLTKAILKVVLRKRIPFPHSPEDAVQQTFTNLWRTYCTNRKTLPLESWIRLAQKTAENVCTDFFRREGRRPTVAMPEAIDDWYATDGPTDPTLYALMAILDQEEKRRLLQTIIEKLYEHNRTWAQIVLLLCQGTSYQQIAQRLNLSLGTVKSSIFKAKAWLREQQSINAL